MKNLIFIFIAILAVTAKFNPAAAQASPNSDDVIVSAQISRNIVNLISAASQNFKSVKGEFLTKTTDSTAVYGVSNMSSMKTATQYVMVRSDGKSYYIASFTGDEKLLSTSFAAFTEGITKVTNGDATYSVAQNKDMSSPRITVYTISRNGEKVGSYTLEVQKKEGTMIIGLL